MTIFLANFNVYSEYFMKSYALLVEGVAYRNAVSSFLGYRNLEYVGVDKEKDLPGLATALIRTSLHSGTLQCIRKNSLHPDH